MLKQALVSQAQRNPLEPAAASEAWYCVLTEPGKERLACQALEEQKFVPFYPTYALKRPHYKISVLGLFPSYIFVQLPILEYWPRINNTRGVRGIVTAELKCSEYRWPSPINTTAIEAIKALAHSLDTFGRKEPKFEQRIKPGARLKITDGPFQKHFAVCTVTNEHRIEVLISLFSRTVKVEIFDHDLELQDEPAQADSNQAPR